jgi:protein SCO1/2
MGKLQKDLPEEIRLVSFSVDPEYDSPEVLAEYAKNAGANLDRWLFLTGEKESIYRSIREGFRLSVEENSGASPGMEVTHSPRFALVDPKGRVRGYYDSADPKDLTRLREDVRRLMKREMQEG